MGLEAANEVFAASIITIFKVLGENLIVARDESDKQSAADRAKKGVNLAQKTLAECINLANSLPEK